MKTVSLMLLLCFALFSAEFFFSPEGSIQNNGSELSPWKTVNEHLNQISRGDTLTLLEGTYHQRILLDGDVSLSGGVLLRGIGEAIIDGSSFDTLLTMDPMIYIMNKSDITIRKITVQNCYGIGIKIGSFTDKIAIDSCTIENSFSSGILAWGGTNITLTNNKLRNTCGWSPTFPYVPADSAKNGIQECISLASIDTFLVEGNDLCKSGPGFDNDPSNGGGEGIDAKNTAFNGIIRKNRVDSIASVGIYVDSYRSTAHNIRVSQNHVTNCRYGIFLASEAGGHTSHITVENNLIYDNLHLGLALWGDTWGDKDASVLKYFNHITLRYNTIVSNGPENPESSPHDWWGEGIRISARPEELDSLYIYGNIVSGNLTHQIHLDTNAVKVNTLSVLDNLEHGQYTSNIAGNSNAKPQFSNSADGDYSLTRDSPGIASGNPDLAPNYDYFGNERDLTGPVTIGAIAYKEEAILSGVSKEKTTNSSFKQVEKDLIIQFGSIRPTAIALYDLRGRKLLSQTIQSQQIQLPVQHLSAGPKLLIEEYENRTSVRRIVLH